MIYSRTTEYAIRALSHVASENKLMGIQKISRRIGVPPAYVSKIFQGLVHSGILHSRRGAKGGYYLRKKPSHLKLKTIIRAIDDPSQSPFVGCMMGFSQCGTRNPCPLHYSMEKFKKTMKEKLNEITLLDIMNRINCNKPKGREKDVLSKQMR